MTAIDRRAVSADNLPAETWSRLKQILAHFGEAWRGGQRPAIEDYLSGIREEERMPLLVGLALEEIELRSRAGESARVEEYLQRFPELDGILPALVAQRGTHSDTPTADQAEPGTSAAGSGSLPQPDSSGMTVPRVNVPGYEVVGVLGQGGMGVVLQARQLSLGRLIALKVIRHAALAGDEERRRFRTEADAVARLQHPNILHIYDVGEYDGLPYMAIEYCPGGSLAKKLAGRPLPVDEAAALAEKLASAVHAAHNKGIIHRDLKPANVLLTEDGTPKIADFGLARILDVPSQTATGAVVGTAAYMAPEQANGKEVGPAADIWALGTILYELLTGRPPFRGVTMAATLRQVISEEPVPPSRLNPRVPPQLEAICLHCLNKDPAQRPASALELAEQLRDWRIEAETGQQAPLVKHVSPRKGGWPRWGFLVAGILAAVLLAAFWVWRHQTRPPGPMGLHAVSPPQIPVTEPERRAQPLTIDLKVWKVASEGFNNRAVGQLGQDVFRVHLNDTVQVDARLSEPAYAYFLLFNPAEKEAHRVQCFPTSSADRPPDKLNRVGPDETITLDDGVGLQAFAVIASRQPLPSFAEWRKQHPALAWEKMPATSRVVWLSDGKDVDGLYGPGFNRATEGQKGDKALIRKLAAQLKELPGVEAVKVMGYAVDPPD